MVDIELPILTTEIMRKINRGLWMRYMKWESVCRLPFRMPSNRYCELFGYTKVR
jgi:hypothetical protein